MLLTLVLGKPSVVGINARNVHVNPVHVHALLLAGIQVSWRTDVCVAGTVLLAAANAKLATVRLGIVTLTVGLLHSAAAGEAAGSECRPGAPATAHLWLVASLARHTSALQAPVITVTAGGAVRPGQVAGAALLHVIYVRAVAPQPLALVIVGAVGTRVAENQLALVG